MKQQRKALALAAVFVIGLANIAGVAQQTLDRTKAPTPGPAPVLRVMLNSTFPAEALDRLRAVRAEQLQRIGKLIPGLRRRSFRQHRRRHRSYATFCCRFILIRTAEKP